MAGAYPELSQHQAQAVRVFNEQLEKALQDNCGSRGTSLSSYFLTSVGDIARILQDYFLPIGNQLLMGSKKYSVSQLTNVRRVGNALVLEGNPSGLPDAFGYLVAPCSLHLLHQQEGTNSALILDNRVPEHPTVAKPERERRTVFPQQDPCKVYDLVNLMQSRSPLIIFTCGSSYATPRRRYKRIEDTCKQTLVF